MVVILALTFGLFGVLFIIALSNGIVEQKVDSAISNEISHIQVHHPNFLMDNSLTFRMENGNEMLEKLNIINEIQASSSRLRLTAMATTANNGTGVDILGIDPIKEREVTKIHTAIIDGDYFEKESKTSQILISKKLAEKLKAKVRSKIVINIQDIDGTITYGLFRVAGIYKTTNSMFDEVTVYVRKNDLSELVQADPLACTELAVLLKETKQTDIATEKIASLFPEHEVLSWKTLDPFLLGVSSMMDQFSYLLVLVILIALAFGIVNTMLMVILERTRELGMLMAVGMNRKRVFQMIMLETIFLSLVGAVIGIIISVAVVESTAVNGINFTGWSEGFEQLGYSSHVFPTIYLSFYFTITIMVIITAIISSIFPARKALKLNPAEAVREDA
jgi:ABC-type lipoprotein release transport system permease subunit